MGKTKWYSDDDALPPRQDARTGAQSRRRPNTPGRYHGAQDTPRSHPESLRMILRRLRRNWLAFQFRFNRVTLGAFRQQAAFKLSLLALVGYLLFGSENILPDFVSREVRTEFVSNEEETTFDVGGGESPLGVKKR